MGIDPSANHTVSSPNRLASSEGTARRRTQKPSKATKIPVLPGTSGSLKWGLLVSAIMGALAAAFWAWITTASGYEFGFLAVLTGGACGLGMFLGAGHNELATGLACVMALFALALARYWSLSAFQTSFVGSLSAWDLLWGTLAVGAAAGVSNLGNEDY